MSFDKNYYQGKLNDGYQKFSKRKDLLLNDLFQLVDRGREDLIEISKSIKETEDIIKEENKKVEETKQEEVKK